MLFYVERTLEDIQVIARERELEAEKREVIAGRIRR